MASIKRAGDQDLGVLLPPILRTDPELLEAATAKLGRWAFEYWQTLIQSTTPLQDANASFMVVFSPLESHDPKRTTEYDRAVALVAAHAVIARIFDLIQAIAQRSRETILDGPRTDEPYDLLRALMEAAVKPDPERALECIVSCEAAARLGIDHRSRRLTQVVRKRLSVFKTLGIEASRMSQSAGFDLREDTRDPQ